VLCVGSPFHIEEAGKLQLFRFVLCSLLFSYDTEMGSCSVIPSLKLVCVDILLKYTVHTLVSFSLLEMSLF
jgi:hypothetical protein